jgi:hypothetical protein
VAFLLLLCNDRQVLGPWVNPRCLNVLSSSIIGGLLVLSCTLLITTVFPTINTTAVLEAVTVALVVGSASAFIALRLISRSAPADTKRRVASGGCAMSPAGIAENLCGPELCIT